MKQCAEFGRVYVSLNEDGFIKEYKGKAPVMNYDERKRVVQSCKYVHRVIPNFGGADSTQAIQMIMPDIIAIGSDWATKDYHKQMGFTQKWLDDRNVKLLYIPYTKNISTTTIKARLK